MHSRAYLLLKRDLLNFERLPIEGLTASPVSEDDLYNWNAVIKGLAGTPWEGGIFHLRLKFTNTYNTSLPSVQFMTIPYHPNVHPVSGVPALEILSKEHWNETYTMSSILMKIQVLLSEPELDSGCIYNQQAAYYYIHANHTYKQLVFDCVTASLRIQAGLMPYESTEESKTDFVEPGPVASSSSPLFPPPPPAPTGQKQRSKQTKKKIPFDDYHALWQGLATTVPAYNPKNDFMQLLDKDSFLKQVHSGEEYQKTGDLQKLTSDHLTLKYGISRRGGGSGGGGRNGKRVMTTKDRQKRIAELAALYATKVTSPLPPISTADGSHRMDTINIDELVAWTEALDEKELENVTVS